MLLWKTFSSKIQSFNISDFYIRHSFSTFVIQLQNHSTEKIVDYSKIKIIDNQRIIIVSNTYPQYVSIELKK